MQPIDYITFLHISCYTRPIFCFIILNFTEERCDGTRIFVIAYLPGSVDLTPQRRSRTFFITLKGARDERRI